MSNVTRSKNRFRHILLLVISATLLVLSSVIIIQNNAQAAASDECTSDQPYNCAMSRRNFDQLVSQWCGLAKTDKQTECRLTFFSFVHHSPSAVRANAGFTIPGYCLNNATRTADETANVPDFCYVYRKKPSSYFRATKKIVDDCGLADNQDRACVLRIQQQFLHDHNADWADEPGPEADSASSSSAINVENEAGKTAFFARVSSYIKWLTLGLGILAVFGLVISGIQYAAAQDNPQAVSGAKTRIYNIVIGILIYVFMFGILQWLIPGGIFKVN